MASPRTLCAVMLLCLHGMASISAVPTPMPTPRLRRVTTASLSADSSVGASTTPIPHQNGVVCVVSASETIFGGNLFPPHPTTCQQIAPNNEHRLPSKSSELSSTASQPSSSTDTKPRAPPTAYYEPLASLLDNILANGPDDNVVHVTHSDMLAKNLIQQFSKHQVVQNSIHVVHTDDDWPNPEMVQKLHGDSSMVETNQFLINPHIIYSSTSRAEVHAQQTYIDCAIWSSENVINHLYT